MEGAGPLSGCVDEDGGFEAAASAGAGAASVVDDGIAVVSSGGRGMQRGLIE